MYPISIFVFIIADGAGGNQQKSGQKNSAVLDRENEELKRWFDIFFICITTIWLWQTTKLQFSPFGFVKTLFIFTLKQQFNKATTATLFTYSHRPSS